MSMRWEHYDGMVQYHTTQYHTATLIIKFFHKKSMSSPSQVKDLPKEQQFLESIPLSKLSNGDKKWEAQVVACSRNPDDPPLLPGWNWGPCEEFYNKAVAYGGNGGLFSRRLRYLEGRTLWVL